MGGEVSRRNFVRDLFIVIAALALPGCEASATTTPATVLGAKTSIGGLQMGDVITVDNETFLLRLDKAYPILDLEEYKKSSKLAEYGRRIVPTGREILSQYPLGRTLPLSYLGIIDEFTGGLKNPKQFGGEMNVYFAGFMTDGGFVSEIVEPGKTTFVQIRQALQSQNWKLLDSLFFTYGEKGFDQYNAKDTAKNPAENITFAQEYLKTLKATYPLVQFNLFGHSLGGIFALEAARENPDAVNNLILINSPIRGIEGTWDRRAKTKILTRFLKPYVGDEQVSDYLFNLWEDKTYQADLEKFVESFTKMGRNFITISADDDPIVPKESSTVKGAKHRSLTVGSVELGNSLEAHGRPLKDKTTKEFLVQTVGENITV